MSIVYQKVIIESKFYINQKLKCISQRFKRRMGTVANTDTLIFS